MNKKRSQTQYYFNVGLQPRSHLRGVALLGDQNLAELHETIAGARGHSADGAFSFRFGSDEIKNTTRLDDLNLKAGRTFEYTVNSINEGRPETIIVDFIDDE